jgi:hypothetical protein
MQLGDATTNALCAALQVSPCVQFVPSREASRHALILDNSQIRFASIFQMQQDSASLCLIFCAFCVRPFFLRHPDIQRVRNAGEPGWESTTRA